MIANNASNDTVTLKGGGGAAQTLPIDPSEPDTVHRSMGAGRIVLSTMPGRFFSNRLGPAHEFLTS